MTDPKPEIVAAADWWARRLAGERSWLQPGDPTPTVGLTRFEPRKRTTEEIEAFRAALVPALDAHVAPHWDPSKDAQWAAALRCVMVDYDPDPALAEAAEAAGLGRLLPGELPGKTYMWINPGLVTVKEGYGARQTLVWARPGWDRPPCGEHRMERPDFRSYRVFNEVCSRPVYHDEDHGDWVPDTKRCATCGGTYVDHESEEAWSRPDRCRMWNRDAPADRMEEDT